MDILKKIFCIVILLLGLTITIVNAEVVETNVNTIETTSFSVGDIKSDAQFGLNDPSLSDFTAVTEALKKDKENTHKINLGILSLCVILLICGCILLYYC